MLKTNLRGQIRQTILPKWRPLLPLFEAVMNSVQAVQERVPGAGRIVIEIERYRGLLELDETAPVHAFTIRDNGAGFNDANFDSFNTAFSEYKLARGGKGLGRFTWLKAFERVEIRSVFLEKGEATPYVRTFVFDENYDPDTAGAVPSDDPQIGTSVRLVGFREPYRSECPRSAELIAQKVVEHFLLLFLQSNCPRVELHDLAERVLANDVFRDIFKAGASVHHFELKGHPFTFHGFRLATPRLSRHRLTYAANDRGVLSENLDDHVTNLNSRLVDPQTEASFVYLGVVQSPYLNDRVNHARTDFDIVAQDDADIPSLFEADDLKRSEIREACLACVRDDLAEIMQAIDAEKEERVVRFVEEEAPHYKMLLRRRGEFIGKIAPNASRAEIDGALHHELYQREVALKREGRRILIEAAKLDSYEEYRASLSTFMADYNELGVSALAQHVMHRRIIIDLLERAISVKQDTGKYPLEKVVHDIIFPMRSSSDDLLYSQQNLWLIDERLNYNSFIASDLPLTQVNGLDSESRKRPDLFIFDRKIVFAEGDHPISSVTLVEFKRPQRDDYVADSNPLDQVFDLVEEIRSGRFMDRSGRPISVTNERIPAQCYIVCDITPSLRRLLVNRDATATPDGQGFYGYHRNQNAYFEVIDYNKLLRDAKRRSRVFFEKLNVLAMG